MRIRQVWVRELFGLFDYDIPMNLEERMTIIIGPNGSGKTTLLSMLNGLLTGEHSALTSVPFGEFGVVFEDGSRLKTERLKTQAALGEDKGSPGSLRITFEKPGVEPKSLKRPISARVSGRAPAVVLQELERHVPWLVRIGSKQWLDRKTGRRASFSQALDRYGHLLPSAHLPGAEWFYELQQSFEVRLISTKRLEASSEAVPAWELAEDEETLRSASAVERYSKHVAQNIRAKLAEYAELSQKLDRTFPSRLVGHPPEHDLPPADLRAKLDELERRRTKLIEAGLLDKDMDLPFGPSNDVIEEKTRPVLSVYVKDVAEKLAVFDEIAARIDLLKVVINKRFSRKRLSIDKGAGFTIVTDKERQLEPHQLSSGEQHELVLLCEFLFETKPASLILIDEPEISFHPAWQREFLRDLAQVAKLARFDALIATHSPQIIADRWDLTLDLEETAGAQPISE